MSLYADYIKERTFDDIIETEQGFATYRYLNEGKSVYIIDIYVIPESRKVGVAGYLADRIVKEARIVGATELLGSVIPSARNSTVSIQVLLGYGMTVLSAGPDLIIFRKEISWDL
jgi:GNAT superfamily N-acetyltransferase